MCPRWREKKPPRVPVRRRSLEREKKPIGATGRKFGQAVGKEVGRFGALAVARRWERWPGGLGLGGGGGSRVRWSWDMMVESWS